MDNKDVKFLVPNETEWQEIETDSEEQEQKAKTDKNKKALNELLLSSMQMQNIVVLSGSGTSLGDAGGPSMSDLWENCTKENGAYTEKTKEACKEVNYDITDEKKNNIEDLLSLYEAFLQVFPKKRK